jgi:hypothetical protein
MSNARKKNYVGEEFGSLSNLLYRHALIWLGTWIPVLSAHMKFFRVNDTILQQWGIC